MRYRVDDLPPNGVGAFAPIPTTNPQASSAGRYTGAVYGAWGTAQVAAPDPAALPSLTAQGGVNSAQGHNVTPNVILPAIGVARVTRGNYPADGTMPTFIGTTTRGNEIPTPAVDPARIPVPAMTMRKTGGRGAPPWPRAFQRWPIQLGSRSGYPQSHG